MYAAIRQGKIKPGSSDELKKRINEGALPIISSEPGFKSFYMVYSDDDHVTTLSIFEDKATAEASNAKMVEWIKKNLADLLTGPPEARSGNVLVKKP